MVDAALTLFFGVAQPPERYHLFFFEKVKSSCGVLEQSKHFFHLLLIFFSFWPSRLRLSGDDLVHATIGFAYMHPCHATTTTRKPPVFLSPTSTPACSLSLGKNNGFHPCTTKRKVSVRVCVCGCLGCYCFCYTKGKLIRSSIFPFFSFLLRSIATHTRNSQVTTTTGNNMVQQQQSDEGGEPEEQYSQVAAMTTQMPLPQETAIPPPRRKRNNSLIPPELMNDNTEGGRERAALATVFGVREYTESKVFWERQIAYYHDNGPVASADEAATAASSGSGAEGYVSITGRSVLSSPLLRRSPSPRPTTSDKLVDHSIASLLDSALDNAGSSDKQAKSTAATSSLQVPLSSSTANNNNNDAVLPTTNLFLLPDIPVVSKFTDFFEETDNLRSPSKVRSFSVASTLPAGEQQQHHYHEYASSVTSDRWANEIAPPLVFIGYPPAIFDLLKSDQDERIIMWGPDPQFLSASMATTTVAGKQPSQHHQQSSFSSTFFVSGSTIATSTQQREVTPGSNKPNIRGFSSNTTAAANTSSADAVKNSSRKSRWVIPDGLKIKKSTLKIRNKLYDNEHEARSSSLFRFSKRHGKNKTMLMLDDQSSISSVNSTQIPQVIEAATVEKLVEKLTISLGNSIHLFMVIASVVLIFIPSRLYLYDGFLLDLSNVYISNTALPAFNTAIPVGFGKR